MKTLTLDVSKIAAMYNIPEGYWLEYNFDGVQTLTFHWEEK